VIWWLMLEDSTAGSIYPVMMIVILLAWNNLEADDDLENKLRFGILTKSPQSRVWIG